MDTNSGNWKEWNEVWRGLKSTSSDRMLYAPGKPQTLLQFVQRCYFDDLWELLGRDAASARCIELGSGRGTTSMYLASRGCNVTLVDLSPMALDQARANFREMGLRVPHCVEADAQNTGLPAGTFDCLYNIGLLEHFEDPRPVLAESWRLLAPGGMLFCVIVPTIPAGRRWLAELLFAPWRLLLRPARAVVKRALMPHRATESSMVRTAFARTDYVAWMRELGCIDVQCLPYSPYHGIWNAGLSVGPFLGLYRAHHALHQAVPKLRTWASVARCDLLLCRK